MKRFIDLGDQIDEGTKEFAWYDTILDRFEEFSGEQTWNCWDSFREAYCLHFPIIAQIVNDKYPHIKELERYRRLFPACVMEDE